MNTVMCNELLRLLSFKDSIEQADKNVSAIQLAQAGFYFVRESGQVCCFSCGCEYNSENTSTSLDIAHKQSCLRVELNLSVHSGTWGLSKGLVDQYLSGDSRVSSSLQDEQYGFSGARNTDQSDSALNDVHRGSVNGTNPKNFNKQFLDNERPSHSNSLPSQNERPSHSNSLPSQNERPSHSNSLPSQNERPSHSNSLPSQNERPSHSNSLPSQNERQPHLNSLPSQNERPSHSNSLPSQNERQPHSNSLQSQNERQPHSNNLPSQNERQPHSNNLPSDSKRPPYSNSLPSDNERLSNSNNLSLENERLPNSNNLSLEYEQIPNSNNLSQENKRLPNSNNLSLENERLPNSNILSQENKQLSNSNNSFLENERLPFSLPSSHVSQPATTSLEATSGTRHQNNRTSKENMPLSKPPSINLSQVSYPQFSTKQARMMTFIGWNQTHLHLPENIAEAGFFQTGKSGSVRCFCCGLELKTLRADEAIRTTHVRLQPTCVYSRLLQGQVYTESHQQAFQDQQGAAVSHVNGETSLESTIGAGATSAGGACPVTAMVNPTKTKSSQYLAEELQVVEREHKLLTDLTTCRMCRSKMINCIFLPCGHVVTCQSCADKSSHCLVCAKVIVGSANVFLA